MPIINIDGFVKRLINSANQYKLPDIFSEGNGLAYTCVNPFSYHIFRKNPQLFLDMDGLFVDGITMCWLIRIFWGNRIPRLSFDMSGMAADLFSYLNLKGNIKNIYFIGTQQKTLERSIAQFHKSYPNMRIVGFRNGFFNNNKERIDAINEIIISNSDFTIIGMGAPLQEQFALDLKQAGYKGTIFTCGGFLHQSMNGVNYYPTWINKYNLRAFYRLFHEKGLWKRLYNVLIEFPILFIFDTVQTKLFATKTH